MTADATRRQILLAAGQVFADRGYDRATVRQICQAAEVNLAAVNYHFGDKRRLYVEAVKFARQLREEEEPMPELGPTSSPQERLSAFVRTLLRRMLGPQASWQIRLLTREMLEPTQACEEMLREAIAPAFQQLCRIVADLSSEPLTPHAVEQAAFSVMGQCMFYRMHGKVVEVLRSEGTDLEYYTIDGLTAHIVQFTLAALQGVSESARCQPEATGGRHP